MGTMHIKLVGQCTLIREQTVTTRALEALYPNYRGRLCTIDLHIKVLGNVIEIITLVNGCNAY
jgi:hypothetical protein